MMAASRNSPTCSRCAAMCRDSAGVNAIVKVVVAGPEDGFWLLWVDRARCFGHYSTVCCPPFGGDGCSTVVLRLFYGCSYTCPAMAVAKYTLGALDRVCGRALRLLGSASTLECRVQGTNQHMRQSTATKKSLLPPPTHTHTADVPTGTKIRDSSHT